MKRIFFCCWLGLVVLAWCGALPVSAQERSGRGKGTGKDPVETAFELPQGTRLTPPQAKALNKMRQNYEPQLRDALDKMNSDTDAKTKRSDAKDALRIRQTIRGEIDQILSGTYEASPGSAPVSYESRYPTSAGTSAAPYNYYAPYVYPTYPYPVYPVPVYPYYPRPYYYNSKYHPATNTSQGTTASTTRPTTQPSTTRPPTTSSGGSRTTTQTKR
jgi:hypothetical protein